MSQIDNFLNMVDTKMANMPVADEGGELTMPPMKRPNSNFIQEAQKPSGAYDSFFESVDKVAGPKVADDSAKANAKKILSEAVDAMSDSSMSYWTEDKAIIEACTKLRNVLSKVVNKI